MNEKGEGGYSQQYFSGNLFFYKFELLNSVEMLVRDWFSGLYLMIFSPHFSFFIGLLWLFSRIKV